MEETVFTPLNPERSARKVGEVVQPVSDRLETDSAEALLCHNILSIEEEEEEQEEGQAQYNTVAVKRGTHIKRC